jgi:oligopeptide/dipeptide ABC transporter ATP-binding protein
VRFRTPVGCGRFGVLLGLGLGFGSTIVGCLWGCWVVLSLNGVDVSVSSGGGSSRVPVLSVRGLKTYVFSRRGVGRAVDGVSFDVFRGETLGLVGESGSGKSMTALSILGLNPTPGTRIVGGEVVLNGDDLVVKSSREMRAVRGRLLGMILQDPMTALNPVLTVGDQVAEPLVVHKLFSRRGIRDRVIELLGMLRIPGAASRLGSFPHQFSGGMRQRVVGAIAMSCNPEVLIADEPTTALDVTLQAAYLELLKQIQLDHSVAIIFITHDFGIVADMCDRVAVMYAGRIVEDAATLELFDHPAHPYTMGLLGSIPDVGEDVARLVSIPGSPPSIFDGLPGCSFAPRCGFATDVCVADAPPAVEVAAGHFSRCWYAEEIHAGELVGYDA